MTKLQTWSWVLACALAFCLATTGQSEIIGFDDFDGGKSGWDWLCAGGRSGSYSNWTNLTIENGKAVTNNSTCYIKFNGNTEGSSNEEGQGAFKGVGTLVSSVEYTYFGSDPNTWSGLSYFDFGTERHFYGSPGNTKYFGLACNYGKNSTEPVEQNKTYKLIAAQDFNTKTAALWAFDADYTPTYWDIRNPLVSNTCVSNWSTRLRLGSGAKTTWDNLTVANSYADIFDYSVLGNVGQNYPILSESFSGYKSGAINGQACLGSVNYGYQPFATWSGSGNVVSGTLTYDGWGGSGDKLRVAGGDNNKMTLDMSALKQMGVVGADGTIGGSDVEGTLYYGFLAQKVTETTPGTAGWFGGAQLFDGGTEVLGIGKNGNAWAYSIFGRTGNRDLNSANPVAGYSYQHVGDTDTHLMLVKIDYHKDANDDLTIWFDPDLSLSEEEQLASLTTKLSVGDLSFDSIQWRGNMDFYYDEFRMGATWASVQNAHVPEPATWALLICGLVGMGLFVRKRRA